MRADIKAKLKAEIKASKEDMTAKMDSYTEETKACQEAAEAW
jgi:hypothetical protein